ncbi:MAG: hypothetical protein K6G64_02430 [Eubacterium sp.]|nr:hypothetical protein [Eubacterium sp.]
MKKYLVLTLFVTALTFLFSSQSASATEFGTGGGKTYIETLADYDEDSTYITCGGENVLVDLGKSAIDDLYSKSSFKNTHTINHFIITHKHNDHVSGLSKLATKAKNEKRVVTINNLYVNGLDFKRNQPLHDNLESIFKSDWVLVKNVYVMGNLNNKSGTVETKDLVNYLSDVVANKKNVYKRVSSMKYYYKYKEITEGIGSAGYKIKILPALKNYPKGTLTTNKYENNHSMCVIYYDCNDARKFKIVLTGDIETAAIGGIADDSTYSSYFKGDKYKDVYYKVPHHGKALSKVLVPGEKRYINEMKLLNVVKPTYVVGTNWANRNSVNDTPNDARINFDFYDSFRSYYHEIEYPANRIFKLKSSF